VHNHTQQQQQQQQINGDLKLLGKVGALYRIVLHASSINHEDTGIGVKRQQ